MTASASDRPEGRRASLRRFVFDRSRNRQSDSAKDPVADPDLRWETFDHAGVRVEDQSVADPWGDKERHEAIVADAEVFDGTPAAGQNHGDDPSSAEVPAPPVQTGGQAQQPSDRTAPDAEPDLFAAEELLDIEAFAIEGGKQETEDWTDLEEAEEDLAHVRDDLRAGAEDDTETDAFRTDDDTFEEPDDSPDSVEVDFDDEAGDAIFFSDPAFGDTFDVPEDDTASDVVEAKVHDPSDGNIGIYDFEVDARQALWDFDPDVDETIPRRAREKAAAITTLVDVTSSREQVQVLAFLTDLFEHLQHQATFEAIRRAAVGGLTPDLLYAMVALRHVWMEQTDWWAGRYGRGFEVTRLRYGASALSWVQAGRVCRARLDHPPEAMINEKWFDEWLCMSPGEPGFLSFPAYIDVKVKSLEANLLDEGLSLQECLNGHSELADDYGWYRHVPDHDGTIRFGFHVLNPYDDAPGRLRVVGPVERDEGRTE